MEMKCKQEAFCDEERADTIIRSLKNDPEFCRNFFYGKNNGKKCNIAGMRSKLRNDLLYRYDVDIREDYIASIVYQALWAEGTWAPLDTYKKQGSFFAWLKKVARNAVYQRVEEEYGICTTKKFSVGNTRLSLLSKSEARCKELLDELMADSKYYRLLYNIYVDRLTKEETMALMDMTGSDYNDARKKAEAALKRAMLNTADDRDSDMIRMKKGHVTLVSSDFLADVFEWDRARTGGNPLSEVLGVNLSEEALQEKTICFLHDFSERMDWSNQDKYIWRSRFIYQTSPVELARELGHSRSWVDIRYFRLKKKFNSAIRMWWGKMAS